MARNIWPGADIHILSIGTANALHGRDTANVPDRGITWLKPLMELVMNAQELRAVEECRNLLGKERYLRLNMGPSPSQQKKMEFDVASANNTALLINLADECIRSISKHEQAVLANILR